MKLVTITKASFDLVLFEITKLTRERDEARRMYCVMAANVMFKSSNKSTAEFMADIKNWDCYKTETQKETL